MQEHVLYVHYVQVLNNSMKVYQHWNLLNLVEKLYKLLNLKKMELN